ncbi:hypothetical protein LCGC14_2975710, partial [marine sediment metagenome]
MAMNREYVPESPLTPSGRATYATLAELSWWAYETPETIHKQFPDAEFFNHIQSDTQFVAFPNQPHPGILAIAVRGTGVSSGWSWTDIFRNAKIFMRSWRGPKGTKVHRGYGDAVEAIQEIVENRIKGADRVIFTGHSLGGSVLTGILSYKACVYRKIHGVSFGAPSFGNKKYYKSIQPRLHRVVFHNDIAPKHPRGWMSYYQPGRWRISHEGVITWG